MKIYRVGGCVRDLQLGKEPKDIDYVVVGESPTSMLEAGFEQVGHFPVFLHPQTRDEYALARSEISTGDGYCDFLYLWQGVSLEEDLKRRDLTINAMAMTEDGELIDLYGGQADLRAGVLRHTSECFVEDPLRILRVARFAASMNFTVADDTLELMRKMTAEGMVSSLTRERIGKETEKAMLSNDPARYFTVLDECGALEVVFPELFKLKGIPQRGDYHAEGDVWVHTLMVLSESVRLSQGLPDDRKLRIRFGALLHDMGKATTPHNLLWNEDGTERGAHHGHEDIERFEPGLLTLAERMKLSSKIVKFATHCAAEHQKVHRIKSCKHIGLANLFNDLDLKRKLRDDEAFLDDLLTVCESDQYGRLLMTPSGEKVRPVGYEQKTITYEAMMAIAEVDAGAIIAEHLKAGKLLRFAKEAAVAAQRSAARQFVKSRNESDVTP